MFFLLNISFQLAQIILLSENPEITKGHYEQKSVI